MIFYDKRAYLSPKNAKTYYKTINAHHFFVVDASALYVG